MHIGSWSCCLVAIASCTPSSPGYFVDVAEPRAVVVAYIGQQADELNASENARLSARREALEIDDAEMTRRGRQLDARLAELYAQKAEYAQKRLARAEAMAATMERQADECRADDCTRQNQQRHAMSALVARARRNARVLTGEATRYRTRARGNPEGATDTSPPPIALASQSATTMESPFGDGPVTIERARELLRPDPSERELDDAVKEALAARRGREDPEDLRVAHLTMRGDSFSLTEFDFAHENGQEQHREVGSSNYSIIQMDGFTRVLSEHAFHTRLVDILGVKEGQRCLRGSHSKSHHLERCDASGVRLPLMQTGRVAGVDTRRTISMTDRGLFAIGYDSRLGFVNSLGLGVRGGLEWSTRTFGVGSFERWKLAALAGVQGELLIDVGDETEYVGSLRPELVLRITRTRAFQLEPDVAYEHDPGVAVHLALGSSIDSLGRVGISGAMTARLTKSGGVFARWDRYRGQSGNNILGGLELNEGLGFKGIGAFAGGMLLFALGYYAVEACRNADPCFRFNAGED